MSSTLQLREYLRGHEEALVDALAFQHIPSGKWCDSLTLPLESAAKHGQTEFVDKLLYAGAHFGRAFDQASEARRWSVLRVLISHLMMRQKTIVYNDLSRDDEAPRSIRVASRDVMGGLLVTALRCAAKHDKTSIVKDLLSAGAGVNSGDALHAAVAAGFLPSASLIARDAGGYSAVRALNGAGKTPLHVAAGRGYANIAAELLACRADVNAGSGSGNVTALHRAVRCEHMSVTKVLLCHPGIRLEATGGSHEETALHMAAQKTVEVVQALVDSGADVNAGDSVMATPLHNAAFNLSASECGRVIGALLDAGANVNAVTNGGRTALIRACSCVNVVAVRTLLCLGNADETLRGADGKKAIDVIGVSAFPRDAVDAVDRRKIRALLLRAPTERMWRRRLPVLALRHGQEVERRVRETRARLVAAKAESTLAAAKAAAVANAGSGLAEARSAEADAESAAAQATEAVAEAVAKAARVDFKRRRLDMGPTHGGAGSEATDNGVMIWVVRTASPEIFRYIMSFV